MSELAPSARRSRRRGAPVVLAAVCALAAVPQWQLDSILWHSVYGANSAPPPPGPGAGPGE